MANYRYISLPIQLASEDLISKQYGERSEETILICYLTEPNIMGFSSIISHVDAEYMCESEEEFHTKVEHIKLMRML